MDTTRKSMQPFSRHVRFIFIFPLFLLLSEIQNRFEERRTVTRKNCHRGTEVERFPITRRKKWVFGGGQRKNQWWWPLRKKKERTIFPTGSSVQVNLEDWFFFSSRSSVVSASLSREEKKQNTTQYPVMKSAAVRYECSDWTKRSTEKEKKRNKITSPHPRLLCSWHICKIFDIQAPRYVRVGGPCGILKPIAKRTQVTMFPLPPFLFSLLPIQNTQKSVRLALPLTMLSEVG